MSRQQLAMSGDKYTASSYRRALAYQRRTFRSAQQISAITYRTAHCSLLTAHCSLLTVFVKLAHATFVTWRWYAEQGVAPCSEPAIEDGSQFRERPNVHYRSKPLPTRQHANDCNPGEVTFVPMPIRWANVHQLRHLFVRMRSCTFQIFRFVVIEPFQPLIAIEWLNAFARPAAQVAMAVGVNFDFVGFHQKPFARPSRHHGTTKSSQQLNSHEVIVRLIGSPVKRDRSRLFELAEHEPVWPQVLVISPYFWWLRDAQLIRVRPAGMKIISDFQGHEDTKRIA